jgi:holo-[acyl-carrier protein] synthase
VLGLGIDIVEIERVARLGKDRRFLERVFTAEEIRYCGTKSRKWQHYAARFAAKEAVWKSLGRGGLALRDISIENKASGSPAVIIRGRRVPGIRISLTHCDRYAAAVAVRTGRRA